MKVFNPTIMITKLIVFNTARVINIFETTPTVLSTTKAINTTMTVFNTPTIVVRTVSICPACSGCHFPSDET